MDGLVLSLELIKFLNWLIENKKDLLESIIRSAAQENVFAPALEKNASLDTIRLHQMIAKIIRSLEDSISKHSSNQDSEFAIDDLLDSLEELGLELPNTDQNKLRIELLKKAGAEFSSDCLTAKA